MRPSSSFSGSEPGRVSQTIAEGTGGERVCLLNLRCGFPWEGKELSGIEGQISAVGPGRTLSAAPKLIRSSLSLDNYGESPRDGEREGERERERERLRVQKSYSKIQGEPGTFFTRDKRGLVPRVVVG